jgi:hypothetical protein
MVDPGVVGGLYIGTTGVALWHAIKKWFFYRPIALSHIVPRNKKTELSLSTNSRHIHGQDFA